MKKKREKRESKKKNYYNPEDVLYALKKDFGNQRQAVRYYMGSSSNLDEICNYIVENSNRKELISFFKIISELISFDIQPTE